MTFSTDTVRRLTEMTDVAEFERVATAVLRAANPSVYENIAHPGVQPGGKTVKSLFDNIGWVKLNDDSLLVCAAHTTEQKDLSGKWMHDPTTVKVRSPGKKPTKPAGDLIKGIAVIERLREKTPCLAVTFALTTNIEPSTQVFLEVQEMAVKANIALDVWSVSRIAHFLDLDPAGQLIRQKYLGVQVQLLSRDLLLKIGKKSLEDHFPDKKPSEIILRESFSLAPGDYLVTGKSGMGKTTMCVAALHAYIDSGAPAIIIKSEHLDSATTIESALEVELKRLEPNLNSGCGKKAIELCTPNEPLLVLFEDISRSASPGLLLNKILSWRLQSLTDRNATRSWRAVCPIWPRYLDAIENQKLTLSGLTILQIDKYTQAEAVTAVLKKAQKLEIPMDQGQALTVASQLGYDPLLIGLHNLQLETPATDTIASYINERIGIVAFNVKTTKLELREAIHKLLRKGMQHRQLTPSWSDALEWIEDKGTIQLLLDLVSEGSLIRLSQAAQETPVEFRHDRVMHSLLSSSLEKILQSSPQPEYVTDPFFAEFVASAAVEVNLSVENLLTLIKSSPQVGAYALKIASEKESDYGGIAAEALEIWLLSHSGIPNNYIASRRYAVARILAEISSEEILSLVYCFSADERLSWPPLKAALFRNGYLQSGVELLAMYGWGNAISGKQSLLSIVKQNYGPHLISAVSAELRSDDFDQGFNESLRTGTLRLAGYIGSSALAEAIRVCWEKDKRKERDLGSYLFAAARCCGAEAGITLGPVCDAWERNLDEPNELRSTVAEEVDREFKYYPPIDGMHYLINRANFSEKMSWPITYLLRLIDHPTTLEHITRHTAMSPSTYTYLKIEWKRNSQKSDIGISAESKAHLFKIALDQTENEKVRKRAFDFWSLSPRHSDLPSLRKISKNCILFEEALWIRASLGDYSATSDILKKIEENPENWLSVAKHIWSEAMTEKLGCVMDGLADDQKNVLCDLEYAIADALMEVEPAHRISMLRARWDKLKIKPIMVQIALLSTEVDANSLTFEAFSSTQNPSALLEGFVSSCIYGDEKRRLSTLDQMNKLAPYLDYFSEDEIKMLWEICTKNGWSRFQKKYLGLYAYKIPGSLTPQTEEEFDTSRLDMKLNPENGTHVILYNWLKHPGGKYFNRDKAFSAMLNWLAKKNEEKALQICANIVSDECTRRELVTFTEAIRKRPNTSELIEALRFDVFSRSLI